MDTRPARRLAGTIASVKTLLLFLVGLGILIVVGAGLWTADDGGLVLALGGLLYGLISAVSIYVTFGWLEHTLRLLVGIAHNTADAAGFEPVEGE
jgi:hypothetical protein